MNLKEWAEANGLTDIYQQYIADREALAEECEAEGYPSHGSNYELRLDALQKRYPELFEEEEPEDDDYDEEYDF